MVLSGIAGDNSYWKKIKKEENRMSESLSPEFMKSYEEALKKAMEKSGVTVSTATQYSTGNTSNGGTWYACWDSNKGGHFITEKDFIPTKIIYNCPATICYFPDGEKEVVKCASDEEYIKEVGVMACIMKKLFKSRNEFKKLVNSGYENEEGEVERVLHNGSVQKVRNDELIASLKAYTEKK
jgi:hypothetical protein